MTRRIALFVSLVCACCAAYGACAQEIQAGSGAVVIVGPVNNSPISTGLTDAQLNDLKKAFGSQATALNESQQKQIKLLEEKLSLTEGQIALAFSKMGEREVPPTRIGEKLIEFAQNYKRMTAEFERLSGRYESFKAIRLSASQMIDGRQFSDARELIRKEISKTADARLEAAELTALEGMLASLEFRYGEAAALYQAAAALSTTDPEATVRYTELQVTDLANGADEHTRRDYLADSIRALERAKAVPNVANSQERIDKLNGLLATVLAIKFNMDRDEKAFEQAKSIFQDFSSRYPPGSDRWIKAQGQLAILYWLAGDTRAAVPLLQALLAQGMPADTQLGIYMNLAAALADLGDADSDSLMVDIETLIGDVYAELWFQARRNSSRVLAKKSYEKAKSHIVLNLLDMGGMQAGLERGADITARIEKLQLPDKSPRSNKGAKK